MTPSVNGTLDAAWAAAPTRCCHAKVTSMLPPCAQHRRSRLRASERSSAQQSESDRTSQESCPCERSHPAYTIQNVSSVAIAGRMRNSGVFRSGRRRWDGVASARDRFLRPITRVAATAVNRRVCRCPGIRESVTKDMQTGVRTVTRVWSLRPFSFLRAAGDAGSGAS